VNGRLVPLKSTLSNGDTVEILTSKAKEAGPNQDWLTFVKSAQARRKIRKWFFKARKEAAIAAGQDQIAKVMRKKGLPLHRQMSTDTLREIAGGLHYSDLSELYAAVGEGRVSAQSVVAKLVPRIDATGAGQDTAKVATPATASRTDPASDSGVQVEGATGVPVRLSQCCTPVPGDEIQGFVSHRHGVSVHRVYCVNATHLAVTEPERMVTVRWAPSDASVFLVAIQVEALDRTRLLSDVTRVLSDQHVNILSASVTTTRDRVAISRFSFEMGDPKHLGDVLRAVRGVDGVYDVYRMQNLFIPNGPASSPLPHIPLQVRHAGLGGVTPPAPPLHLRAHHPAPRQGFVVDGPLTTLERGQWDIHHVRGRGRHYREMRRASC
jgi:GTP diphosphokinase / guanosine-3',5'-bis(diphosphate) 3'-diphosphatase